MILTFKSPIYHFQHFTVTMLNPEISLPLAAPTFVVTESIQDPLKTCVDFLSNMHNLAKMLYADAGNRWQLLVPSVEGAECIIGVLTDIVRHYDITYNVSDDKIKHLDAFLRDLGVKLIDLIVSVNWIGTLNVDPAIALDYYRLFYSDLLITLMVHIQSYDGTYGTDFGMSINEFFNLANKSD